MGKFVMFIGISGSGKSTYANKLKEEGYIVHSSDCLREELLGDINEQSRNDYIFSELHRRIRKDLIDGKNVVYDACNINRKKRMAFLSQIRSISCDKIAILFATPFEQCLINNSNRERRVPEYVIKRMYEGFNIPMLEEGFDSIDIQFSDTHKELYNIKNIFEKIDVMNQHNPHHTLSIGKHCRKCAYEISKAGVSPLVFIVGLLHDIGKAKTQSFLDKNGEKKDHASYYNHHNVSSYDSIIILKNEEEIKNILLMNGIDDILYISGLIEFHMNFYFCNTEKSLDKFKNFIGKEMYADLCVIHEADISAKYDI